MQNDISFNIYDIVTYILLPWYVIRLRMVFKMPKHVADNYLN